MSTSSTFPVATETARDETPGLLLRAVGGADQPQSLLQILKAIPKTARPTEDQAAAAIQSLVEAGSVFAYPPVRGNAQYWVKPPADLARQQLLRKVERGPMRQSEILGAVEKLKSLQGLPKKQIREIFAELLNEGRIHKHPPYLGARTALYSASQIDPSVYLKDAIKKLSAKLGVTEHELIDSHGVLKVADRTSEGSRIPEANEDHRIIEAMIELDPRVSQGGMVAIADLRRQLNLHFRGRELDQALLKESAAGRVAIHLFDRANLVPEEERRLLLQDEKGNFYNCVSLRRQA